MLFKPISISQMYKNKRNTNKLVFKHMQITSYINYDVKIAYPTEFQ